LRTLFSSSWFYSDAVRNTRIKSPVMLVVSFLRALGRTDIDGAVLVQHCDSIGQSLMQPPTVGGWQGGEAWITESTILQRSNITNNLLARLERRVPQPRPRGAAEEAGMTRAARGKGRAVRSSGEPVPDLRLPLGNLVRIADASTAESIVDLLVRRFLTMPLRRTDREALIGFLNGADGSPGYAPDRPWRAEVKLRQLVHLLTACAEFQLC
jgi:hypothetical protein